MTECTLVPRNIKSAPVYGVKQDKVGLFQLSDKGQLNSKVTEEITLPVYPRVQKTLRTKMRKEGCRYEPCSQLNTVPRY